MTQRLCRWQFVGSLQLEKLGQMLAMIGLCSTRYHLLVSILLEVALINTIERGVNRLHRYHVHWRDELLMRTPHTTNNICHATRKPSLSPPTTRHNLGCVEGERSEDVNLSLVTASDTLLMLWLTLIQTCCLFYHLVCLADGSYVSTRRLSEDNHQRREARQKAGPHPPFLQGRCEVPSIYAGSR